jgi:multicomponent Na+:H+ antiporter subunit E
MTSRDMGKIVLRLPEILGFAAYVFWELVKSNVQVVQAVLSPRLPISPGIVAVPLDLKSDAAIFIFANVITLTPGTMTVEVSDDRSRLYVHALLVGDKEELVRSFKSGFETRIARLFR